MVLPKLIGILGRSRSGKDTVANIITDIYPENYTIQRFAQPIKNALREIYEFTPEQLEDDQKEVIDFRYNITPRQAMQEMTTHYLNKHGAGFFSDKVFAKFDNNIPSGRGIIIPDVRYAHDIHQIRSRGGIVIKVIRSDMTLKHLVENHIIDLSGDYEIINDATIQSLKDTVRKLFINIYFSQIE
jgi:hypothetical protein